MATYRSWSVPAAVALAVCIAPPVAAEPVLVTITSGTAVVDAQTKQMQVTGTNGFSLDARMLIGTDCVRNCGPFAAGQDIRTSAGWSGLDVLPLNLTLGGVTYDDFGFNGHDGLLLNFQSAPFTLPAVQAGPLVVQFPFTFSGQFLHGSSGGEGDSPFTADLIGQGTATLTLQGFDFGGGVWEPQSIRWEFAAMEPIPEPATVVLIGFGVAGAWGAARRRRPAKS